MKRIIEQSRLWLAPAVLAAAALLACNDNPTAETQATTTQSEIESPGSTDGNDQHRQADACSLSGGCSGLRSADDFLPGSRHVPKC